ncbi:hypothetical protein AGABI2DRAFT_212936 [Agaricus bisporus var. bisporus H97]|uniref:hypothetical protein n=1 Tax=Agaricus bisporus var. bisporus (strain H97 / ATCC MYA-4626 / FGSC 10389) TaxID=936046 RepID=UPI00029F68A9|nr:hypothetical protein AGABI2DRAFT_212936 [Agaricus bisporus var. bisporus H97]EKV41884.1 hypothetical protein AGABI2DRAFT_212936 [Agaricus bisporus var. bisporus H97]
MGNDGGSIPDRRDLVRTKAKAEQADKANQTRARWHFCALSKRKLQEPVVACALGKLYNKDSIIEYLLDKSAYGDGEIICGHIQSLKDVKQLKLTLNPIKSSPKQSLDGTQERAQFACPLTLKEMNGSQPFVYLRTCGCVFTLAGLKTMTASGSPKENQTEDLDLCPQCQKKFSRKDDMIALNPSPEEEERLYDMMNRRKLLEPAKKTKKRKISPAEEEPPKKKQETAKRPHINSSVASSKAVASELAMHEVKRKTEMSAAVRSLYGDGKPKHKETFLTRGTFPRTG